MYLFLIISQHELDAQCRSVVAKYVISVPWITNSLRDVDCASQEGIVAKITAPKLQ